MLHHSTQRYTTLNNATGGGFCRHIEKAFIALCSDNLKCRSFRNIQDLATVDALRDIDYPSCAYFGTPFAYMRMRARVP